MPIHSAFHYFKTLESCRQLANFYKEFQDTFMNQIITFDVTYLYKCKDCIIYNGKHLYFSMSYKNFNFFKFSYTFYFSLLRRRGPIPEAWQATFGQRATSWETLVFHILH